MPTIRNRKDRISSFQKLLLSPIHTHRQAIRRKDMTEFQHKSRASGDHISALFFLFIYAHRTHKIHETAAFFFGATWTPFPKHFSVSNRSSRMKPYECLRERIYSCSSSLDMLHFSYFQTAVVVANRHRRKQSYSTRSKNRNQRRSMNIHSLLGLEASTIKSRLHLYADPSFCSLPFRNIRMLCGAFIFRYAWHVAFQSTDPSLVSGVGSLTPVIAIQKEQSRRLRCGYNEKEKMSRSYK